VGVGGLVAVGFLYGYTAIASPGLVHSLVLPALWVLLFALACAWFTRRPVGVAVLPVVALVVWAAAVVGPAVA
jgi:hypothetical protein